MVLLCYAHQINLIVGDIFKASDKMRNVDAKMRAIVTFWNNHSRPKALLDAKQLKPLTLIRPVVTRWTSHFVAAKRLLLLQIPLQTLVIEKRNEILALMTGKDALATAKILNLCRDPNLWADLTILSRLLEPLCIAALVMQKVDLRLDQALLTLGKLSTQFESFHRQASMDSVEKNCAYAVIRSLEKRWNAADQDVFIAATILNPFIGRRRLCFSSSIPSWQGNRLYLLIKRVYLRLFPEAVDGVVPSDLMEDFMDYKQARGNFSDECLLISEFLQLARDQQSSPNPLAVWRSLDTNRTLSRLALRLLQIVPSTASNEKLFSLFGIINSHDRASLQYQATADTARLRANIVQQNQTVSQKRKLGSGDYAGDIALSTTQVLQTSVDPNDFDSPEAFAEDFELSVRDFFHQICSEHDDPSEDIDLSLDPGEEHVTLQGLFNASSTLDLTAQMHATWTRGTAVLEEETAYFESLARPEREPTRFERATARSEKVPPRSGKEPAQSGRKRQRTRRVIHDDTTEEEGEELLTTNVSSSEDSGDDFVVT